MQITIEFSNQIIKSFGTHGKNWLLTLPEIIDYSIQKWQLINLLPVKGLQGNYVAYGYSNVRRQNIVLKISVFSKQFNNEKSALLYFNGNGVNRLLDYDETKNILLLDKIGNGITLKSLFPDNDNQAVYIASSIINKLRECNKKHLDIHQYPTLSEFVLVFNDFNHPEIAKELIKVAKNLAQELVNKNHPNYLLHGDLHHYNIISSNDGSWVSIDPHGVIGHIEYEVGAFIRNPIPDIFDERYDLSQIINNRFNLFAKLLNLDKNLVISYSYISTMLAIIWDVEDNGSYYKDWLKCLLVIKNIGKLQ